MTNQGQKTGSIVNFLLVLGIIKEYIVSNNSVSEFVCKISTHIVDHNLDYSTKENGKVNIKMDIISGYKNSINTSWINNSRGVNPSTN